MNEDNAGDEAAYAKLFPEPKDIFL